MLRYSVATKIEIGLKMNMKILQFLKIDRRRIRRIFINSKILRRLQFLRISSKQKNLTLCVGKLKFKVLKEVHILDFFRNFVQNIVKFSRKIFAIFGLKSSKLRRFFSIWKWTEDEDKDGSSDKNRWSFEYLRSFIATLMTRHLEIWNLHNWWPK